MLGLVFSFIKGDRVNLCEWRLKREYNFRILNIPYSDFEVFPFSLKVSCRGITNSSHCEGEIAINMKMLDGGSGVVIEETLLLGRVLIAKQKVR
jgi:hypothetical protein